MLKESVIFDAQSFRRVCSKALDLFHAEKSNLVLALGYHTIWMDVFRRQIEFLTRVDDRYASLSKHLDRYESMSSRRKKDLINAISDISKDYSLIRSLSLERLKELSLEESNRIDEAFHCLAEECYWSAIINSAVALESRLFALLKRRGRKTLIARKSNLVFTLGELADVYLNDKSAFSNCIPKRYEHLLKLVNSYRIVSAHPKQFDVDKNTADAIFNLTLRFLLDEECKLPKKRGRKPKKS